MDQRLIVAFSQGYERMSAWSDLLDAINLYPVADSDTGRNLRLSLAPLKSVHRNDVPGHLLMSAIGNSGNIAGAFFGEFTRIMKISDLPEGAATGRNAAWKALRDPKPGTMLSVFDAIVDALDQNHLKLNGILNGIYDETFTLEPIVKPIMDSVLSTSEVLVELRDANVVDSGALGMFLFFEGFFKSLFNDLNSLNNPYDLFGDKLRLSNPAATSTNQPAFCIDTVLVPSVGMDKAVQKLSVIGEHVVTVSDGRHLKVHLHAPDEESARTNLAEVGSMLKWHSEKIEDRKDNPDQGQITCESVHIMTDAAGSLTTDVARQLGITLLDSYVMLDQGLLPESSVSPGILYAAMSRGVKATTCQASVFERHQRYECLAQRFSNIVYLCVGSAYTGNYETAKLWAEHNQNGRCMTVIDTGAASGRLGLIARNVAQFANSGHGLSQVVEYAAKLSRECDELIFLDQLKFLAAGGRISKTSRFVGDLLSIKPVIRPGRQGAQKIGVVKNQKAQLVFLLDYLGKRIEASSPAEFLLQYTDNQDRVVSQIQPKIQRLLPNSRISVQPMSVTSGVHMGPGTWAVAFLCGSSVK